MDNKAALLSKLQEFGGVQGNAFYYDPVDAAETQLLMQLFRENKINLCNAGYVGTPDASRLTIIVR